MSLEQIAMMQNLEIVERFLDRFKTGLIFADLATGPDGSRVWSVQGKPVLYASPVLTSEDGSLYWFFIDL